MKIIKRVMSLFMLTALISSLAGCNKSSSDSQSLKDNYVNLKGRIITIGVWSEEAIPNEDTSSILDPYTKRYNEVVLTRWKDAEKKYNCKIQWKVLDIAKLSEIISGFKAGKSETDIIYLTSGMGILDMIQNKLLEPLDQYIDYEKGVYANEAQKASLWKGRHYGLVQTPVDTSQNLLLYNKTLINKLGFPDPSELQEKNQWTWDEFLSIAKKATADTNNDGSTDRWGIIDMNYTSLYTNFIYSNGGGYIEESNSKFAPYLNTPATKEAMEFVTDLYNKLKVVYKVDPSSSKSRENAIEIFDSGKAAFSYSGSVTNKNFEVGMVIWPKGPKASEYIAFNTPGRFYAVPSCVDDPKGAAEVLEYIMSVYDSSKKDYIDYEKEVAARTPKDQMHLYQVITSNIKYSWFTAEPKYTEPLYSIFSSLLNDGKTVDEALKQEKNAIDELINELNKID